MMLDHLGLETEAAQIMTAIDVATASGVVTGDLGGAATTTEAGDAIADAI